MIPDDKDGGGLVDDSAAGEVAVLVKGRLGPLKEMRGVLAAAGIEAQLLRPPDGDPNA